MTQLFVYGTLMPGQVRWHLLERFVEATPIEAEVCGQLFDTGWGWPAAVFGPSETSSLVPGKLVAIDPSSEERALALLDEVEGVSSGMFSRIDVFTGKGTPCCTYSWRGLTGRFDRISSWVTRER
jgi:gamma-glutamylcyclotransferase (GGCT)/AIG2-like uncharacterized protein YtfP